MPHVASVRFGGKRIISASSDDPGLQLADAVFVKHCAQGAGTEDVSLCCHDFVGRNNHAASFVGQFPRPVSVDVRDRQPRSLGSQIARSEEHTSELQSLMRISYAVLCLKNTKI